MGNLNTFFFSSQLFGLGGLIIMMLTGALNCSWRHPTWFNFCITWSFSCISYWTPIDLCASLPTLFRPSYNDIHCPYFDYGVQHSSSSECVPDNQIPKKIFRKSMDHHGDVMLVPLIVGSQDPETVQWRSADRPYCNMGNNLPTIISYLTIVSMAVIGVVLEFFIFQDIRRIRNAVKATDRSSSNEKGSPWHLAMAIRIFIFSVYLVVGIVLGIILTIETSRGNSTSAKGMDASLASLPFAVVLIFGTQRDLILTWTNGIQAFIGLVQRNGRILIGKI
ncbi:hypothetical protein K435DRAFT_804240 [Dendrothele bispora CBS 962.96]|uniref:Uncharacterized protein n=1 Tax=Dendrothele bispora (strain CBS 962.96) TaxID=1314807 RepID=A0A4S8LFQ7_DENBC|nr:hypothetical protein K435DRAFT_804240 [Dendrothele bispora CBS 962.96]